MYFGCGEPKRLSDWPITGHTAGIPVTNESAKRHCNRLIHIINIRVQMMLAGRCIFIVFYGVSDNGLRMKVPVILTCCMAAGLFTYGETKRLTGVGSTDRCEVDFNTGWLFAGKDIPEGYAVRLDEAEFMPVCLPHTSRIVPHTAIDTSSFAMISWYRKHFFLPEEYRGRRVSVEFQAVSKAARVYCNGKPVGEHRGAYTPFDFDITGEIAFGNDNVIAVRVDSRQRKDIPPEGIQVDYMIFGGIVRDVTLKITGRLSVARVYVKEDPETPGSVFAEVEIANGDAVGRNGSVTLFIVDPQMNIAGSAKGTFTVASDTSYTFSTVITPEEPLERWHPDNPFLYTLCARISGGGSVVDEYKERFGMRSVRFDEKDGRFYINGRPMKLRGLNRHETYPYIGRAASNRLQRRDAEIIKYEFGCNIVRCSHYPQDPEFLDRCDEIGLMVLEEIPGWNFVSPKKEWQSIVLENTETMVLRDRNHPSVISFGVRINQSADFRELYRVTNRIARTLDPGRPTHGVRVLGRGSRGAFFEDVWAQNFLIPSGKPEIMPWITSESVGHIMPTHSWDSGERLVRHMLAHAGVHDSAAANPEIAGLLGWCAFDYHSPHKYAERTVCYHGVADMFRLPKHAAYFYRSQADPEIYGPMVYIAHFWDTPHSPNDVWVTSNCDSVELFVNGVSHGGRLPSRYTHLQHPLFVWRTVPFRKGEIKAVGFIEGKRVAGTARTTPGVPAALSIAADDTVLATGGDMTRVVVTVVDRGRQVVRRADCTVKLNVTGAAVFLGENPVRLEDGTTAFFIKTRADAPGTVVCSARSKGLSKGTTRIRVIEHL